MDVRKSAYEMVAIKYHKHESVGLLVDYSYAILEAHVVNVSKEK